MATIVMPDIDTRKQLEILNGPIINESFESKACGPLLAKGIDILQVSLGYMCNLSCKHCHTNAGPGRKEIMSRDVMDKCLDVLNGPAISTVDITGGGPELHPQFRKFIRECSRLNKRILVRTNCAILTERGFEDIIDLYAELKVGVIVSLPNYNREKTERQRGHGVFDKVIMGLQKLNEKGYGQPGSGLALDIAHNPAGAYLPASQASIRAEYSRVLKDKYDIIFNNLFCITNMPIGRFLSYLIQTDNYKEYMQTLVNAYNPRALENVMCKSTISVAWDGTLYDCDFNQVLGLPIGYGAPDNIMNFDVEALQNRRIVIANHCFGCAAGAGSSCQGALDSDMEAHNGGVL